jgi:hypothetical protein
MKTENIKIKFIYQSPNTDEPNKKFISKKYDLKKLLFERNPQIDFTDGSYLMMDEMEEQYITLRVIIL